MVREKIVMSLRVRNRHNHSRCGQAVTILILFLSVFVIAPLAILTVEVVRYSLAKQQLKACVESCALAAAATNANGNDIDPAVTQLSAITTAINVFHQNSILDQSMVSATQSSTLPLRPDANRATLYFQFLNPITRQPVPIGSTDGKVIQVTGAFGVVPMFENFLGWHCVFPAVESSSGGLPMLDVVLCFDISSSMDDFTPISIVDRYKNGTSNGYKIIGQGNLYSAFHCTGATGSALNATFPQNLDADDGTYRFSGTDRSTNNGAAAPNVQSSKYTDVVVNIDGTSNFNNGSTVTINGATYIFPANSVGCLVEAARGNLESVTLANNAKVPYASWGITPKPGYYQAYVQAAFAQRHPIGDAIAAARNFFVIMNNDCDAHFGLVTFGSNIGSSPSSTCPSDIGYSGIGNITDNPSNYNSNNFPKDPLSPKPPNPEVDLIPTLGPEYSNFSQVDSSVVPLVAYGGTNISGALECAINQLRKTSEGGRGLSRKGATKAIVLFTDGLPTATSLGGNPTQDARTEARIANQYGIPVYCIGLCMVPALQASQTAV